MLHQAMDTDLIPQWLAYIESEQTKDAFVHLVGLAATLTEFRCHAQFKGEVRDFRFITMGEEQPFSFIPNKHWLLFYFRAPSIRLGKYTLQSLQREFDGAAENTRGEWAVRIRSISDVQRLWKLLAIK